MMRKIQAWLMMVAFVAAIGGGLYLWWTLDLRWRPHAITKDQAEIAKILDGAGWVSPGLGGPKLYMISFRSSPEGVRFEDANFPALQKAQVDTRVIMIARPDLNGASNSTPAERSTVAELWVNRNWPLFQRWTQAPIANWTAPGVPAADGDVARSAVVEAGRDTVETLKPLLKDNGIRFACPVLIWWAKDGQMRGAAGGNAHADRFVREELGAR